MTLFVSHLHWELTTMNNFDFCNPTRILFGKGQIEKINELVPADCSILLVAGGGSIKKMVSMIE